MILGSNGRSSGELLFQTIRAEKSKLTYIAFRFLALKYPVGYLINYLLYITPVIIHRMQMLLEYCWADCCSYNYCKSHLYFGYEGTGRKA